MSKEERIIELLTDIKVLLQRQTAPITALEIEQLARATPEHRKAHGKKLLRQAREDYGK